LTNETNFLMLGFAWLTLRQAEEALNKGRLEEAQRLLSQPAARGHKRSWKLLQQVALGYVERGERRLRHDDAEAAWLDLLQAEQMGGTESGADRLRQALVRLGLTQVRALLEAGDPGRAVETVAQLGERSVRHPELKVLEDSGRGWLLARELANRGEFGQALGTMDGVRRLLPGAVPALTSFHEELQERQRSFPFLLARLHGATAGSRWADVLALTEQVLAQAPQHKEARKLRDLAWKAVQPATVAHQPVPAEAAAEEAALLETPYRFLLWIDGIGGYLVCLGGRVTLGQATAEASVDVPLFADVSRQHATITRDAEGYLLETLRPVKVNMQPVERTLLRPNDRVTLGACCQMVFRQPAAVSATALLEVVSGHRLPLALDGVLLMAETLILGPGPQAHVTVPSLKQPVVLFRHKDGLGVRCVGGLTVNGQKTQDRALLGTTATVSGDDFAFAIEPVGERLGRT
jgi:hypothetical protein